MKLNLGKTGRGVVAAAAVMVVEAVEADMEVVVVVAAVMVVETAVTDDTKSGYSVPNHSSH
jgi:hypothetical protein